MDTVFYILSILSFAFGLFNFGGVIFLKNQINNRGTWTLTLPMIPLLFITVLLILEYYLEYRYPGKNFILIMLLLEWSRITVALSWNFIVYYHYALNGLEQFKRKSVIFLAGISGLLFLMTGLFLLRMPAYMVVVHILVIVLFYHAGIRAVLILRKKKNLLPSSRAALSVAIISLIMYPVVGIGDPLGWRIPFLNPALSLWVQSHPLYFIIINIPFFTFIISGLKSMKRVFPADEQVLSQLQSRLSCREKEVFDLLMQGLTYNQIAGNLFISLATVKTHIQHIYAKLGVKRREELFIKFEQ